MTAASKMGSGDAQASPDGTPTSLSSLILRLVGLGFVNAITIFLVFSMVADGIYPLAIVLGIAGQSQLATFFVLLVPGCLNLAFMLWLCLYVVIFPDAEGKRHLLVRIEHELQSRGKQSFSFANDN